MTLRRTYTRNQMCNFRNANKITIGYSIIRANEEMEVYIYKRDTE